MIKLRKIDTEDLEMIRKWRVSLEISKYMLTDPKITPEDQRRWFKKISNDETCIYWIVQYDSIDIGLLSIFDIDNYNKNCLWAYYIVDINMRGKGIGKNLECNIHDYIFYKLDIHKIIGDVLETNKKILEIHQHFGYVIEGTLKENVVKNDHFYDIIKIALMRKKWDSIRSNYQYQKIEIEG